MIFRFRCKCGKIESSERRPTSPLCLACRTKQAREAGDLDMGQDLELEKAERDEVSRNHQQRGG